MTENETSVLERKGGITVDPKLSDEALAKVMENRIRFRAVLTP